jgi:hypothetical protein
MHKKNSEKLCNFFTEQQPLGSIESIDQNSEDDQYLFRKYFHESNRPYAQIRTHPTMIVGRRGAGKTDALLSHRYIPQPESNYSPLIYFEAKDSTRFFQSILYEISNQIRLDNPKPMVENIADLWVFLFWIVVFQRLAQEPMLCSNYHYEIVARFVKDMQISENEKNSYEVTFQALKSIINKFEQASELDKRFGFFNRFEFVLSTTVSYSDAKTSAKHIFLSDNRKSIILLDSFENLNITQEESSLTLSGLLRAVSRFHDEKIPIEVRCCIPGEAYTYITKLSSNILKDFERQTILHWTAMEILQLCAKRFSVFIELYYRDYFDKISAGYNLETRKGTIDFWSNHLPATVPNLNHKIRENTFTYLMRHTQLLPRHMILLLNKCLSEHLTSGEQINKQVSDKLISKSVLETEHQVVQQIVKAHEFVWPDADQQIGAVLKRLGHNVVGVGDLHRAFNKSNANGYGNVNSFNDFLRMLTEVGAVGRLIRRTDHYVVATYEYSESSRLLFNEDDMLCIHPCFTRTFRVLAEGSIPDDYLPIYPYGANVEDKDRRALFDQEFY